MHGFRNVVWSSIDYLVLPILWIIFTPIFVNKLGVDQYGIWMLVNSVIGASGAMNFGLAGATVKFVAKYRATYNKKNISAVTQSSIVFYIVFGLIALILLNIISPILITEVFKVKECNHLLAIKAIKIAGVGIFVKFIDEVFVALLQGFERYDYVSKIAMPINIATVLVNLFLALRGFDISYLLISTIIIMLLGAVFKFVVFKMKVFSDFSFKPSITKHVINEVFAFGVYSWVQSIGSILFSQLDRLIIAAYLGTASLTYYTVAMQLAQQINVLLSRAFAFIFPLSSVSYENGEFSNIKHLYFISTKFVVFTALLIGGPLYLFSDQILTLWMGSDFSLNSSCLLRPLVISSVLLAASVVPFYLMNGTNFVRLNTVASLSSGVAVAITMLSLINVFGAQGAAWARLATLPVSIYSRTLIHYKLLNDKRWYIGILIVFAILAPFSILYSIREYFYGIKFDLVLLLIFSSIVGILCAFFSLFIMHYVTKYNYEEIK